MAEYLSSFAGKEVDRAISKLKNWAAAGFDASLANMTTTDTYDTVTINSATYAVLWKVAPTSSNTVYGIGLSTTTGAIYQIKSTNGTKTAVALDTDTKTTAASANSDNKLFLIGRTQQSSTGDTTYSNTQVYETAGTLNATKFTVDAAHTGGTIQYNTTTGCIEIIC